MGLRARLLWLAAAYQFFDGVNFASAFCLRGAGDARVPALIVLACGTLLFLPLTHILTFAPGEGWFDSAPGYGLGAVGGWSAILVGTVSTVIPALLGLNGAWPSGTTAVVTAVVVLGALFAVAVTLSRRPVSVTTAHEVAVDA